MKKILSLMLIVPLLVFCGKNNSTDEGKDNNNENKEGTEVTPPDNTDQTDPFELAGAEFQSGDELLATNRNVEKFLTEVTYPDKDWSYTEVLDYYGGFDGVNFSWAKLPDSDKPEVYSIRWSEDELESGAMTLHLADALGWEADVDITEGSLYVNITNLVPNDSYTYSVTTASGKVLREGNFTTTGSLHQCFFRGNKKGTKGARNCRDLGGWATQDGKHVKYRKIYRGGRLNEKWDVMMNNAGKKELQVEGIMAQLDLRGVDDVMDVPALPDMAFCAPVIEQGGKTMLVSDHEKTKQCFEFVVECLRENKPVYFHCSLGRDRTGTLGILLLGLLGVPEGDISKEYEVTYFAPSGYSVSSSEKDSNPKPIFKNTRKAWVYSDVAPYFWEMAGENGTFADGVEKYLLEVAQVSQKDIDDYRTMMLTD